MTQKILSRTPKKNKFFRVTGGVFIAVACILVFWAAMAMDAKAESMMVLGLVTSGLGMVIAALACLMAANAVEEALGEIFERDETITMGRQA